MNEPRSWFKRHELFIAALIVGGAIIAVVSAGLKQVQKMRERQFLTVWNVSSAAINQVAVRSRKSGDTVLRGRLLPDAMIIEALPNLASDTYELLLGGVPVATCVAGDAPKDKLVIKIEQVGPPVVTCDSSVKPDVFLGFDPRSESR